MQQIPSQFIDMSQAVWRQTNKVKGSKSQLRSVYNTSTGASLDNRWYPINNDSHNDLLYIDINRYALWRR